MPAAKRRASTFIERLELSKGHEDEAGQTQQEEERGGAGRRVRSARTEPKHGSQPVQEVEEERKAREQDDKEVKNDQSPVRPQRLVRQRAEYSIGARDVFNADPEEERTTHDISSDGSGDEHEYAGYISVGSSDGGDVVNAGGDGDEDGEDLAFYKDGAHSTLTDSDAYYEASQVGGHGDVDERYVRLLQQQEIALAQSYLVEGFLGSELVEAALGSEESLEMSYEELIELEESLGEVKKRGMSAGKIANLPRIPYSPSMARADSATQSCVVCMTEFARDERLIRLVCGHYFHDVCAEGWLRVRASCPMCREDIQETEETEIARETN